MRVSIILLTAYLVFPVGLHAQKPRERDLKLPIGGTAGPLDAITDVAGVEVGHTTLISGTGTLVVGKGPVRTGVTVIHPRGKANADPVFAAWFTLNGNGEMTGTTWIQESGLLEGPVAITNTHSVGVVRDAIIQWEVSKKNALQPWWLPVVAETYDGGLNDINGFHVKPEHVLAALDSAAGGLPKEGAVGGGTGMVCHGFKGGIGTASRKLPAQQGGYTVGVLVQCNYGSRRLLRIAGAPVGAELSPGTGICYARRAETGEKRRWPFPDCAAQAGAQAGEPRRPDGSIIIVVATDAPLLPHQIKRLAKRPSLGLGRLGSVAGEGSGDIFIAFSTANPGLKSADPGPAPRSVQMYSNDLLTPLFEAATQATEEAVVNAMVAARTMEGADGVRVYALPHSELQSILGKYGRLAARR